MTELLFKSCSEARNDHIVFIRPLSVAPAHGPEATFLTCRDASTTRDILLLPGVLPCGAAASPPPLLQPARGSWYFRICIESHCRVLLCSLSASDSHHTTPTESRTCAKNATVGRNQAALPFSRQRSASKKLPEECVGEKHILWLRHK